MMALGWPFSDLRFVFHALIVLLAGAVLRFLVKLYRARCWITQLAKTGLVSTWSPPASKRVPQERRQVPGH